MVGCEARVMINASNLHAGGAIQVASSFIYEFLVGRERYSVADFEIWVSKEVAAALELLGLNVEISHNIRVVDVYGLGARFSSYNKSISDFDLVFTIFGPNYYKVKSYINVVGFAQFWILDDSAYRLLSMGDKFKSRLKFFLQRLYFKASDSLVVELEHVRDRLLEAEIATQGSVYVAHNCVSSLYLRPETWEPLSEAVESPNYRIGFLGRDYAHKNTSILSDVKGVLLQKYRLDIDFFVTLDDQEWARKSEAFRSKVINVGSLSVTQCPSFYKAMDAIIFPSLLECFSATPLEAMAMEKPLFASDRRFVKDICGDFAFYFDPLDAENIADVIAEYIHRHRGNDRSRLVEARSHAVNFSSAKQRADRYVEIIRTELAKNSG